MWSADKRPLGCKLELGLDIQNPAKRCNFSDIQFCPVVRVPRPADPGPSSILQSSTFGGFWDLDKIWSEKLHLFAGFWTSSPSSNLQPSGLLSAVHTHNLAVYSNLAAFGQAESLNRGRVQNVLRPKIGLNRGPKWEK